jgi:chaperonin GroES
MKHIPRPPFDRVLVLPDFPPSKGNPADYFQNYTQRDSGILVPGSVTQNSLTGTVLAVGEGKYLPDGRRQPMTWKAGDRVLYSEYNNVELKLNGIDILSMREENIILGLDVVSDNSEAAKLWADLIGAARMTVQLEEKATV